LEKLKGENQELGSLSKIQEHMVTRLTEFCKILASGEILEEFDRVVFECGIEKIIIGG